MMGDHLIRLLYDKVRENSTSLFNLLTSSWSSSLLSAVNFDLPLSNSASFAARCGINPDEYLEPPESLNTPRKVFERKIRYNECRPIPQVPKAVLSPADARVLIGSLQQQSLFLIKNKFFVMEELLGSANKVWLTAFNEGDFAIFRLTPDKYHYNHTPVAGEVIDHYQIDGSYHSCNPSAVISVVTPYSKNKRVVTIIDTDVKGGSQVGLVAMIEVVALMIGDIVQAYSSAGYDSPQPVSKGMNLLQGQPKSLYRPGSSTDILLFQQGRVQFCPDLIQNQQRRDVQSRFSLGFGQPLVETDIKVRSLLATAT